MENNEYKYSYEVLIYPKTFNAKNAAGKPPRYMFTNNKDDLECGRYRYWYYGNDEDEVKEYVYSLLNEEDRERFEVCVDRRVEIER